ncbi:glycosyltransferase family 9 protein [bacterium]|nr:glycosyltransferase family 9 protein [bacterium]
MNVLLVKLGALGDVLRTTCLIPGIRRKWPSAKITFLSRPASLPLLCRIPDLGETVTATDGQCRSAVRDRAFDVLVNLDEDREATDLAETGRFGTMYGIGREPGGKLRALAPESERLVRLTWDDRLKFHENQRSYPALIYEAIGAVWEGDPYRYVPPPDAELRRARLLSNVPGPRRVGLFVGASERYANKFWSEAEILEFCRAPVPGLFLLGGPSENARMARLGEHIDGSRVPSVRVDHLDDLAAVIGGCSALISGDTLAMHLATALGIPSVTLFGPTSSSEIFLYGRGRKIISPYACGPCYLRTCDIRPSCMSAISADRVRSAVRDVTGGLRD